MGLFGTIANWFKNLFSKVGSSITDFAKKAWILLEPFVKEILDQAKQQVWEALKELAIIAIQQVVNRGLATDEEKQQAFADIMKEEAGKRGIEIKDSMLNLLRETAYAIYQSSLKA